MALRTIIFTGLLSITSFLCFSQDYFSYGGGNFSGINQAIANPASAADNRLKVDILLTGADFTFNNSWFAIKRAALKYSQKQFPASWKNNTPSTPDNFYKNFVILNSGSTHAIACEARILLPSVMLQINSKNAVAFTWNIRSFFNVSGISDQFANLFENELNLSATQNTRVQNQNFSAVQMTWAEYGLTYARVLRDKDEHFFKAGITPKLLQGIEAAYLVINELDFLFSNKDTNSYFKSNFSFAHSGNFISPFKNGQPNPAYYQYTSKPAIGVDIGVIYEWRPHYQQYKYKIQGKRETWRKDQNKYKLKLGAAIVDIGKIKFKKQGTAYDLNVAISKDNFTNFLSISNVDMLDSMLRADFSNKNSSDEFSILLPTAFNTQADLALNKYFFLNLSTHFGNFYKNDLYKINNYTAICFAPRVEHYWFDVSVPLTYNVLSAQRFNYITTGLNLRIGPLSLGTNNLVPFFKGNVSSINCYALLKLSIPYKTIRDRDQDGITDKKDVCPDHAGTVALYGCPDSDSDGIADHADGCPHQPGLPQQNGCPDKDADGIADAEDDCPDDKGTITFKGCPDTDNDGIIDKNDLCAMLAGLKKYEGCPDTDNDSIHNGIDLCPTASGPFANKGCPWPDADNDGVIDQLDSCKHKAGTVAYNGCPPPVALAIAEKRVLEKAFSSLEFESGKDIIKPSSYASLRMLAKLLLIHESEWKIKLGGHTDNDGTAEKNLALSEKRVKAVQKFLVKQKVKPEVIILKWYGQSRPIADNSTNEGKRKNRRVEMTILSKEDN